MLAMIMMMKMNKGHTTRPSALGMSDPVINISKLLKGTKMKKGKTGIKGSKRKTTRYAPDSTRHAPDTTRHHQTGPEMH